MSQYTTGRAVFTNGSNIVTGVGTLWNTDSAVQIGHSIKKKSENAIYDIASVDSDTQIKLTVPYAGSSSGTAEGNEYQIQRDWTPLKNLAEIDRYTIDWPFWLTSRVIRKLDVINACSPVLEKTDNYVATLDDLYKTILFDSSSQRTLELPLVTSADVGAWIRVVKIGTGGLQIHAGDGAKIQTSVRGGKTYTSYAGILDLTIQLIKTGLWIIVNLNLHSSTWTTPTATTTTTTTTTTTSTTSSSSTTTTTTAP